MTSIAFARKVTAARLFAMLFAVMSPALATSGRSQSAPKPTRTSKPVTSVQQAADTGPRYAYPS